MPSPNEHPSKLIRVEVDRDFRYSGVEFAALDADLRITQALAEAFDEAYSDAMGRMASELREERDPSYSGRAGGGRPHIAGPVLRGRPAMPEVRDRQPRWDLINAGFGAGSDQLALQPVGRSGNDCVHVRLDRGSSRGRLIEIDQGWLSQATASNLASAVDQAFADAYEKGATHG